LGESTTIFKLVLILGVMFLLIGTLLPGADSAWTQFSNTVQSFPSFQNPFSMNVFVDSVLTPSAPGGSPGTPHNLTAIGKTIRPTCVNTTFWDCMNTNDGNESYVFLAPNIDCPSGGECDSIISDYPTPFLPFDVTGDVYLNGTQFVQTVLVEVWCRSNTTAQGSVTVLVDFFNIKTPLRHAFSCPVTLEDDFRRIAVNYDNVIHGNYSGFNGLGMTLWDATAPIQVTYIQVSVTTQRLSVVGGVPCAALDIACELGRFGAIVVAVFQFIFNIFAFFGEVILWFAGIVVGFATLVAFFFVIPGAPTIVQSIIVVVFVGIIAMIAFIVLKIVRGSGATG